MLVKIFNNYCSHLNNTGESSLGNKSLIYMYDKLSIYQIKKNRNKCRNKLKMHTACHRILCLVYCTHMLLSACVCTSTGGILYSYVVKCMCLYLHRWYTVLYVVKCMWATA